MWLWRPDGDLAKEVPLTRRIMPLIMRGRTESVVFYEQKLDVGKATAFLRAFQERTGKKGTLLHLILFAATRALRERPRLNRFVAGGRIWQRRGIWLSFSAKKARTDDAPVVVVKRRFEPDWTFEEIVDATQGGVDEGRGEKKTSTDKELGLLFALPLFLTSLFVRLVMAADQLGLLPGFFTRGDPMFASVFIANLGSIGMDAPFHHLYEYGNIPLFIGAGQAKPEVVPGEDGTPVVRDVMTLRYTFDERIEDGLYCLKALDLLRDVLEDPAAHARD